MYVAYSSVISTIYRVQNEPRANGLCKNKKWSQYKQQGAFSGGDTFAYNYGLSLCLHICRVVRVDHSHDDHDDDNNDDALCQLL